MGRRKILHASTLFACSEPGCTKGTNGKPACPDHLAHLPYVREVLAGLRDKRAQAVLVECSECAAEFEALPSKRVNNLPGRCPACRKRHEAAQTRARKSRRQAS